MKGENTNILIANGVKNYSKDFTLLERIKILFGATIYHLVDTKTGRDSWGINPSYEKMVLFRQKIADSEPDEEGFTKEQRDYIVKYAIHPGNQNLLISTMVGQIRTKWPDLNGEIVRKIMEEAVTNELFSNEEYN